MKSHKVESTRVAVRRAVGVPLIVGERYNVPTAANLMNYRSSKDGELLHLSSVAANPPKGVDTMSDSSNSSSNTSSFKGRKINKGRPSPSQVPHQLASKESNSHDQNNNRQNQQQQQQQQQPIWLSRASINEQQPSIPIPTPVAPAAAPSSSSRSNFNRNRNYKDGNNIVINDNNNNNGRFNTRSQQGGQFLQHGNIQGDKYQNKDQIGSVQVEDSNSIQNKDNRNPYPRMQHYKSSNDDVTTVQDRETYQANTVVEHSIGENRHAMPRHTEVHITSPIAAGLPILEVVKRLDEEGLLTKDDKLVLQTGLYTPDPVFREKLVKALCDVELSMNSVFSLRRLKTLIHNNPSGLPSSNNQSSSPPKLVKEPYLPSCNEAASPDGTSPSSSSSVTSGSSSSLSPSKKLGLTRVRNYLQIYSQDDNQFGRDLKKEANVAAANNKRAEAALKIGGNPDDEEDEFNCRRAINQVVGDNPEYAGPAFFNVCSKISKRMRSFLDSYTPDTMGRRRMAVIVGSGSFNPLTRMHLRTYFLAKQYLESKQGFVVLGALLAPAHGVTVRERYRTNCSEIIPSPHRLAIGQLLVQNSRWLSIDPWEITRRRPMDYLSLLTHTKAMLTSCFPDNDIKIFYISKANAVPKLSPVEMRANGFGLLSVCRAPESDTLRASLGSKWNGVIHVVEDAAVLDASVDTVTSRNVRDNIKAGQSVAHLVGEKINVYVQENHITQKMTGVEDWSADERKLAHIASRPAQPVLEKKKSPGKEAHQGGSNDSSPIHKVAGLQSPTASDYAPSWAGGGDRT